jgi:hypothetical protein
MRGGMLRYYSCTALYACDDTVSLRMVEIPGKNVGSGRRRCGRVHCSTDLPDRTVTGWYRRVGCRMFLRSGYGCSDCMSMLPTTCLCAYGYTSSRPNLSEPCTIPPLPLPATAPRLRLSVSGGPCMWLRFRPTFGGRLIAPGAASVGSGPALEHQNRPHPSGGGDDISRPDGFSIPENTRIASRRRRVLPALTWGVPAVFLSNNHGQTIMVGPR